MSRVDHLFVDLVEAARIVVELQTILRFNRLALFVQRLLIKQRRDKKLAETIERFFESRRADIKEKARNLGDEVKDKFSRKDEKK